MNRLVCWTLAACLAVAACSQNESKVLEDYVPKSGELAGWVEDTSQGEPGVEAIRDVEDGFNLFNGGFEPFAATGKWVAMAFEYYVNGDMRIELQLHEMEDVAGSQEIYDVLGDRGMLWIPATLGDEGHIADQGPYWLVNARKARYFIMTHTYPGDETERQPAEDFVRAVADGLPAAEGE